MVPGFIMMFLVAVADWVAVGKDWKKVEYVAKPATMALLLGWLVFVGGLGSLPLICFSLGVFFSLAGDIFLLVSNARFSERWFIPGLVAFLLAHVAYIIGLNIPLPDVSPLWSILLAIILAWSVARILRRIIAGIRQKGLGRMVLPVGFYGTVITLMLLSALLTLNNLHWGTTAASLVALGAILLCLSDIILAWNKFVNPIRNGRLVDMILYHLGQLVLVAGVMLQFAK